MPTPPFQNDRPDRRAKNNGESCKQLTYMKNMALSQPVGIRVSNPPFRKLMLAKHGDLLARNRHTTPQHAVEMDDHARLGYRTAHQSQAILAGKPCAVGSG